MNIKPNRLDYLYQQYLEGALTSEERNEWRVLLDDSNQEDALKSLMDQDYELLRDGMLVEVNENRNAEIVNHILSQPRTIRRKLWSTTYFKTGIAAAIALIITGVWFYNNSESGILKQVQDDVVVQDVAPGKQGATLTLANGKKIRLTEAANGELAKEAGITITKTANGQLIYEIASAPASPRNDRVGSSLRDEVKQSQIYNTLSTAKGETYQVRLPDGSMVWLNAASSLKYPASFAALKERRVTLSGEGYFEIAKDKIHPFIVASNGQEVAVLGTHFNINSYSDESSVKTTLLEGSVRVRHADLERSGKLRSKFILPPAASSRSASRTSAAAFQSRGPDLRQDDVVLKPGQQTTIKGNEISVATVDTEDVIAWKNGDIQFDNKSIPEVMRQISRWYGVEVVYEGSVPSGEWNGSVSRMRPLSQVLRMLEKSKEIKFRIEGKTIFVSK